MGWMIPVAVMLAAKGIQAYRNRNARDLPEQGSPYWPGSEPRIPNSTFGTQGGGGGGGGSSSTSTTLTNQTQKQDLTTIPVITPQYQPLESVLRGTMFNRLAQPTALPRGYQANGIANINDAFDLGDQSLGNRLASAGISGPMAGAAIAGGQFERNKTLAGFTNELPLQERQLRNEDMDMAAQIISAFGRGQNTKGTVTTSGKTTSTGSSSGGGGGGPMNLLGDQMLQGYFGRQQATQAQGGWFDRALGYAAAIAGIYASLRGGGGQ